MLVWIGKTNPDGTDGMIQYKIASNSADLGNFSFLPENPMIGSCNLDVTWNAYFLRARNEAEAGSMSYLQCPRIDQIVPS